MTRSTRAHLLAPAVVGRRVAAALVAALLLALLPAGAHAQAPGPDDCPYGYDPAHPVWLGADTGVPNYDVGDGCTIMDLLDRGRPFDGHGDFIRSVSRLTGDLRRNGVVSGRERARIVSAAARSEVGLPPAGRPGTRPVDLDDIGVVGYTVRATMPAPHTEATLAALAECGYRNIEPSSGLYGYSGAELGDLIDDAGLDAPSVGLGLGDLEDDLEGLIETAKGVGAEYVRFSGSSNWDLDDYREVADLLNEAGRRTMEEGIMLAYHNHGWEFEEIDGVRPYDVLLRETDPRYVGMELDVYWAASMGVDAVDLFEQYPGRFPLLHLKDMAADGSMADVGEGTIDWGRIFRHWDLAGVEYAFTEHDQPQPDGLSSACDSIAYLKDLRF